VPERGATDRVFAALADPTRREIFRVVGTRDGTTATELAADLPVTRQAVAKHLAVLAEAGLVDAERNGREQRYRATPAPLDGAVRWLAEAGAAWDARLDRLRDHVGEGGRRGRR
jgi:DNA-binding transcriptional ArsR family regulator